MQVICRPVVHFYRLNIRPESSFNFNFNSAVFCHKTVVLFALSNCNMSEFQLIEGYLLCFLSVTSNIVHAVKQLFGPCV